MGIFGVDPFCYDWDKFNNKMDEMFNSAWNSVVNSKTAYPVDILHVDDKDSQYYEIRVALAGLSRECINVRLEDRTLVIDVDVPVTDADPVRKETYIRVGIKRSKMTLKYKLGTNIDITAIKDPEFMDGILSIKLPIVKEDVKSKVLKIK